MLHCCSRQRWWTSTGSPPPPFTWRAQGCREPRGRGSGKNPWRAHAQAHYPPHFADAGRPAHLSACQAEVDEARCRAGARCAGCMRPQRGRCASLPMPRTGVFCWRRSCPDSLKAFRMCRWMCRCIRIDGATEWDDVAIRAGLPKAMTRDAASSAGRVACRALHATPQLSRAAGNAREAGGPAPARSVHARIRAAGSVPARVLALQFAAGRSACRCRDSP